MVRNWQWSGIAALVLAASLTGGLLAACGSSPAGPTYSASDSRATCQALKTFQDEVLKPPEVTEYELRVATDKLITQLDTEGKLAKDGELRSEAKSLAASLASKKNETQLASNQFNTLNNTCKALGYLASPGSIIIF